MVNHYALGKQKNLSREMQDRAHRELRVSFPATPQATVAGKKMFIKK